jgi:hypothetical protein
MMSSSSLYTFRSITAKLRDEYITQRDIEEDNGYGLLHERCGYRNGAGPYKGNAPMTALSGNEADVSFDNLPHII